MNKNLTDWRNLFTQQLVGRERRAPGAEIVDRVGTRVHALPPSHPGGPAPRTKSSKKHSKLHGVVDILPNQFVIILLWCETISTQVLLVLLLQYGITI